MNNADEQGIPRLALDYQPRACPLCGRANFEEILNFKKTTRTRRFLTDWDVHVVVCNGCGFAFASPAPSERSLTCYYSDSYAFFGDGYYDSHARLRFIDRYLANSRPERFLEIGGNTSGSFHDGLRQRCSELLSVEINDLASCGITDTSSVRSANADLVVSYFVLEHILDPLRFVSECRRIVSSTGMVVLEVPDLDLYDRDAEALDFPEHLNHFSADTLVTLAQRVGLTCIEISSEDRSRRFGVVAAFRPSSPVPPNHSNTSRRVLESKETLRRGWSLIKSMRAQERAEIDRLCAVLTSGKSLVIWGMNAVAQTLAAEHRLHGALWIDSNPEKRSFLPDIAVLLPEAARDQIQDADVIYICSSIKWREILHQVENVLHVPVADKRIIVTTLQDPPSTVAPLDLPASS